MSISSIFGSPILLLPNSSSKTLPTRFHSPSSATVNGGSGGLLIDCSSRPKKKATAHHMKTRPKKSQPWDINRKPTVYPPLPVLPPDWTLVSSADDDADTDGDAGSSSPVALPSTPDLQAPIASG